MLNALQAQTEVSIYQYENTGEAVTCLAGKLEEVIYGGVNKIYNYSIKNNRKKYMKKMKQLGYCLLVAFLLTACQSYKKVPYLQDAEVVLYSTQNEQLYDAKIMPKDLLTIVVSCTSPELAAPFNLTVATQNNMALNYVTTQPVLQQYLVDNEGNINFPVLGELHVGGLTKKATEQMIRGLWLTEIYRGLFNHKNGFTSEFLSQGLTNLGIIIFRIATETDGSFITSDNPVVFQKMCVTTNRCPNGIYFPLTPQFLLFLGKRTEGTINDVIFRTVGNNDVREINRVILNGAQKAIVSTNKHLGYIL